jgi:hypothetical protein
MSALLYLRNRWANLNNLCVSQKNIPVEVPNRQQKAVKIALWLERPPVDGDNLGTSLSIDLLMCPLPHPSRCFTGEAHEAVQKIIFDSYLVFGTYC